MVISEERLKRGSIIVVVRYTVMVTTLPRLLILRSSFFYYLFLAFLTLVIIYQARLRQPNEEVLLSFGENLHEANNDRVRILVHQSDSIKDILKTLIPMEPEELAYPPASLEEYFLQFYQRTRKV